MINILNSLGDIVITLITFVIHTISSLILLIGHIPQYAAFLINSINVLPEVLIPFALATVSLGIVLFVLGRSHG